MRWDLGYGAGLVTADDGVVVAAFPYDEVELGAERLGELDATQLEATHPGGHFVGIEREEDVAELLDFALLVGTGAATLEAVQLLVIEVQMRLLTAASRLSVSQVRWLPQQPSPWGSS